jgi:hypothetical protein
LLQRLGLAAAAARPSRSSSADSSGPHDGPSSERSARPVRSHRKGNPCAISNARDDRPHGRAAHRER